MPRKKRGDVRAILRKKLEEPDVAERVASLLVDFPSNPEKVKPGDVLKVIEYAQSGATATATESVEVPDPADDLSAYSDAELWEWLRRLEGGPARGP